MAVNYTLDHERRVILVTWQDRVSVDDILQVMAAVHNDPGFDPSYATLCDYTAVQEMVMTGDELDRLLKTMDEHDMRQGCTAMVMPQDRAQQNVGKVVSAALAAKGSDKHRVFTSHLEAEVWLGLRDISKIS